MLVKLGLFAHVSARVSLARCSRPTSTWRSKQLTCGEGYSPRQPSAASYNIAELSYCRLRAQILQSAVVSIYGFLLPNTLAYLES
jgi:hypothetical protein